MGWDRHDTSYLQGLENGLATRAPEEVLSRSRASDDSLAHEVSRKPSRRTRDQLWGTRDWS